MARGVKLRSERTWLIFWMNAEDDQANVQQKPQNICDILNMKSKLSSLSLSQTQSRERESVSTKQCQRVKRVKKNTAKWTVRETKLFYRALEIYGLEFHFMAQVFPNKDSKQLLKKYHKEFKKNQAAVEDSMKTHERNHSGDNYMKEDELKAYLQNVDSKNF